jgi:competence protein ComEC
MVGLAAFLAGLALARLDLYVHGQWLLLAMTLMVVTAPRLRLAAMASVLLLGLLLGIWRGSSYLTKLRPYDAFSDQSVVLRVTADTDATYEDRGQLSFDADSVHIMDPVEMTAPGKIKVAGFGEPAIYRGDVVQVEGKLFKTLGSRQATVSFAELKVLGRSGALSETARHGFVTGMLNALPEPNASFGLGLLIGQRSTLPDDVSRQLGAVGLTHIIAVSGYNLTIIIEAVRRLSGKRSKYQSLMISLLLIGLFLSVTGFSASIVRAAMVSLLSLLAWYYGRTFRPLLLLLLAAALTAGWYPVYLWADIGWYLSFLAFFGVLIVAPLFIRRFHRGRQPKLVAGVIIESLSAQLMTAPLVLYIFGVASLIAPLSNVVIVPLVPVAMLLSLVAGIAGMVIPALAGWLAWPANILLTYMLDMVHIFSDVPRASVSRALPLSSMLVLYGAVILVCLVLWQKTRPARATITEMKSGVIE